MNKMTSDEELLADLGLEPESEAPSGVSAKESRIISGFEEIEKFYETHGRLPEHGEDKDIFERIYAVRLDAIRKSEECRFVLTGKDKHGLLNIETSEDENLDDLDDEDLLSELGISSIDKNDITKLKHVKSRAEVRAADEIASRVPCQNFSKYKILFEKVQQELNSGVRKTIEFRKNSQIRLGEFLILGGQKLFIAEMGEEFISEYNRPNQRMKVIYDNGTESNLLLRSLQTSLVKDANGRRITDPALSGPLFSGIAESNDTASGTIYVLRSKSDNPIIAKNREVVHKIGVTTSSVKKRIVNAHLDPTFLMADVEVMATYELSNISRSKLEALIHKFFDSARLEIEIKDRFGLPIMPREWFLVPLFIIDEAIHRIKDGTIQRYRYDVKNSRIIEE
ncbi:GIY-YIG nuclease family protein [bacterium]|nr:GIY-YIG nuclease family protein [bacterium]